MSLSMDDAHFEPRAALAGLQGKALVVGLVGAAATALGFFTNPDAFYRPYLVAWIFFAGLAMGLFALGMLNHVSGGLWGVLMRRVSEAAGRTLPLFILLGLPFLLDLSKIYHWAEPGAADHDPLLAHKAPYLDPSFFIGRTVAYFLILGAFAFMISRLSARQDASGSPSATANMQRLSSLGLILYVLICTFASVDWVMSLDPHWFSSLFGLSFVVGTGLTAFPFIILFMLFLIQGEPFKGLVKPSLFHDYGKLTMAFTMLWGYLTVSQFLIIWSGNLPEEITWYIDRNSNGWKLFTVFLMVGHFFLPFLILLSREIKLRPRLLRLLALWILLMRWFDYYWQATPSLSREAPLLHWMDLTAMLAIGGLWLAAMIAMLKSKPMVPVQDARLKEVLAHG